MSEESSPRIPEYCLDRLHLNNFKSYKGEHLIGPFMKFTCIIGPNGSGKSNIMDAVCFVLGIQSTSLRAHKITDFIYHGVDEEDPLTPTLMYVEAFFKRVKESHTGNSPQTLDSNSSNPSNSEISFLRSVSSKTGKSTFYINGVEKSYPDYVSALRTIGLDTSLRNFLVFQGDIDNIAVMTPQQRTLWFERTSKSDEFRDEYERLKEEYEQDDTETNRTMTKKRAATQEQRVIKMQKQESEKFQQLLDERNELQSKSTLFMLFHIEKAISQSRADQIAAEHRVHDEENNLKEISKQYEEAKKTERMHQRKVIQEEQELLALTREKATADAVHEKNETTKQRASDREQQCVERIHKLKEEIAKEKETEREIDRRRKELEKQKRHIKRGEDPQTAEAADDSDVDGTTEIESPKSGQISSMTFSPSPTVMLDPSQLAQYIRLKAEVETKVLSQRNEIALIEPQLLALQQTAEKNASEEEQLILQRDRHQAALTDVGKNRLAAARAKEKEALEKQSEAQKQFQAAKESIQNIKERQKTIAAEIERRNTFLREARCDIRESQRTALFTSTVSTLQRLFPGVKGVLHELVDVNSSAYATAVTAAMGVYMDAIVVEKESVARECITYIQQQHIAAPQSDGGKGNRFAEPFTGKSGVDANFIFLPLDSIRPAPLKQNLRLTLHHINHDRARGSQSADGTTQDGAHLVFDLLKFDRQYEQAVLYAVGSTVVFPSLDQALVISADLADSSAGMESEQIRAVTLDGDLISKQGFITSGSSSVHRHAQVWEQKEFGKVKRERVSLIDERKNLSKTLRSLDDEAMIAEITVKGMEDLLISIRAEIEALTERQKTEDKLLKEINKSLTDIRAKRNADQVKINNLSTSLEQQRDAICKIEDDIFKAFCEDIHVSSIRDFEQIQNEQSKQREISLRHIDRELNALKSKKALLVAQSSEYILKRAEEEQARAHEKTLKAEKQSAESLKKQESKTAEISQKQKQKDEANAQWRIAEEALNHSAQNQKTHIALVNELRIQVEKCTGEAQRLRTRRDTVFDTARMDEIQIDTIISSKAKSQTQQRKRKPVPEDESSSSGTEPIHLKKKAVSLKTDSNNHGNPRRKQRRSKGTVDDESQSDSTTEDPSFDNVRRTQAGLNLLYSEPIHSQTPLGSASQSQTQTSTSPESASNVLIDFRALPEKLKALNGPAVAEQQEKFRQELQRIKEELQGIIPNLKASDQLASVEQKLAHLAEQHSRAQRKRSETQMNFLHVKEQRKERFMHAFDHIAEHLDSIYGELTRTQQGTVGHAFLELESRNEPYLGGIKFHIMPPSKGFREIEAFSGGEKAIASLAFLFAFNSYNPSPFFLLDEVDDALDSVNVIAAARYIHSRSSGELFSDLLRNRPLIQNTKQSDLSSASFSDDPLQNTEYTDALSRYSTPLNTASLPKEMSVYPLQCIVISLKGQFFDWADSLIGVSTDREQESSQINTLDLTRFTN